MNSEWCHGMRRSAVILVMALAGNVSAAEWVEDFSTLEYADIASSTGVWNLSAGVVQARAFADADVNRPMHFGDGSDGIVSTAAGYVFNTDQHPLYQFQSLRITGGAVTVTGSNPLIIRSLGEVTITSALSISGGNGVDGATTTADQIDGPGGVGGAGGQPVTSLSAGGAGGIVSATNALLDGQNGKTRTGADEPNAGSGSAGGASAGNGNFGIEINGPDFDVNGFFAGSGGGGGGAYRSLSYVRGGGGGAGGGALRITAAGPITLGSVAARGGDGGVGAGTAPIQCGGGGAGGNGGVIWLQSLGSVTVTGNPDIVGGLGGTCPGGAAAVDGIAGFARADTATAAPAWAGDPGSYYQTTQTTANQTYLFQSRALDLGTVNAGFDTPATVESDTSAGGAVLVEFSGSSDGSEFSSFTSDLASLSGTKLRYLKWRISVSTAGVPAASPSVTRLSIPYRELGYSEIDFSLGMSCGALANRGGSRKGPSGPGEVALLASFLAVFWLLARRRAISKSLFRIGSR